MGGREDAPEGHMRAGDGSSRSMSLRSWVSAVSLPSRLRAVEPASLCLQFPILKVARRHLFQQRAEPQVRGHLRESARHEPSWVFTWERRRGTRALRPVFEDLPPRIKQSERLRLIEMGRREMIDLAFTRSDPELEVPPACGASGYGVPCVPVSVGRCFQRI